MSASNASDASKPHPSPQEYSAEDLYGVVPNFFQEMEAYTDMPSVVYMAADDALMEGLLSPRDQQAVLLKLSQYYSSRYDAVVHARMALDAGLPPQVVDAILDGETPDHSRYGPLVEATFRACEDRGWMSDETLTDLEEQGVSRGDLYEIFALIGIKTFSSFTNHIADTAVDDALQSTEDTMDQVPEKPDTIQRKRLFLG